jgi:DNA-binding NarL/FixJ family response regulator
MIKVALVDDQENVRRTLCRVLAADSGMNCVAACSDGEEALRLIPAAAPDVVLMDLEMPGMKGSAVT